jgi:hypothetical protein
MTDNWRGRAFDSEGCTMQTSEGGCLCGAVRYRVVGAPLSSSICHCITCRRASGAPTVAWVTVDRSQLEILSGEPRAFQSSPHVVRRFCATCGSALTYENADDASTIDITTLSLDDPERFPPSAEVWVAHKLSWQTTDPSRAQRPQGSSAS